MATEPGQAPERRGEACMSDLALERLLAGDLAGAGRNAVLVHLAACAACAARLDRLERSNERFVRDAPVAPMVDAIARGIAGSVPWSARPRRRAVAAGVVAAVVGIAAAIALFPRTGERAAAPAPERKKGGVAAGDGDLTLELIARHADGRVARIASGASLTPGEAVRFHIASSRAGHLAIVGIDAVQVVTPYAPAAGAGGLIAVTPGEHLLAGSIILDDTLGVERIVAVRCDEPVPIRDVVAAARRALAIAGGDPARVDRLELGCAQTSVAIVKVAR
jgi:hypothetical protein